MIYLSRLLLNPRSRAVRLDLADCHNLHRTILRAFPQAPAQDTGARDHFDVLYRLDEDRLAHGGLTLLVQSGVVPGWSHLADDYLVSTSGDLENPACKSVDHVYDGLAQGMTLAFRLRANPTKKIDTRSGPDGQRRNGKRVELRDEAMQLDWLRRKGEQNGFALLATKVNPHVPDTRAGAMDKVTGLRPSNGHDTEEQTHKRLTFGSVLFEGRLHVTDPEALRHGIVHGIGSGKAYGFGLLSLAPVRG